jgi:hypothetical protein
VNRLEDLGFELWLDGADIKVWPVAKLTADMRAEIADLKVELVEYLGTVAETVVDDPEERAHGDMRTLPRTPEEAERQRAEADRERERARRRYQGGAVLINDPNNFGHYMRQLRRQREAREAAERGESAPPGRYVTRFNVFG